MLLRALAVLLLLANLVFFSWTRGWWAPMWPAPRQGEREPERVAAQVLPEAITLWPAASAASGTGAVAPVVAPVCLEAGPLEETGLGPGEAALAAAQLPEGSWARVANNPAPIWLVYAGRVASEEAKQAAQAELQRNGLSFELIDAPAELAPGLVLSRHNSRALADAAMAQVQSLLAAKAQSGLRGLRVVALPAPPTQYWLRVDSADAALQARVAAIPPQDAKEALAGGFKACALRP
jgi:hypothetical protein